MLYLAQVHKNEFLDQYQLRLLARQEAENCWVLIPEESLILLGKGNSRNIRIGRQFPKPEVGNNSFDLYLKEKLLVLVQLSSSGDIEKLEEATNWILHLVQTYLRLGVTPESLQKEREQAEQWRQKLTLDNQDLARRTLELEARREQIQALEENLKRDPKQETPQEEEEKSEG
ncbi:MAG: hypothetical protein QNJ47_07610 [Nostocaceae cyanobacterium]|nr:hypothetical protein [Nostocaceae cyanobacterium]